MSTPQASHCRPNLPNSYPQTPCTSKLNPSIERKIMKAFLLHQLHLLFCDIFHNKIQAEKNYFSMEYFTMDSKIIQFLIQNIIDTGAYTLEGIANYTRIPFDVIFDAACGNNVQLSITLWVSVVHLYLEAKPDVAQLLFDKLNQADDKNHFMLSLLVNEQ